ncbi:MAG: hypothetical protein AB1505_00570 [Candidatus Latescibacterota bacterium]
MGCGLPVVLTEPAYAPVLGPDRPALLARAGDLRDLAEKLAGLLCRPAEELRGLGLRLRERARQQHALEGLMGRLVGVLCSVSGRAVPWPVAGTAVPGAAGSVAAGGSHG